MNYQLLKEILNYFVNYVIIRKFMSLLNVYVVFVRNYGLDKYASVG